MRKKVLVIDDDSLRRVVEFTQQESGYRVQSAAGGEEGLTIFDHEQPPVA